MIKIEKICVIKEVIEYHPHASTLEADIRTGRKVGNSTRQVNFAIERLFDGFVVEVRDHYENGKSRRANEELFRQILERLDIKGDLANFLMKKKIDIDLKELTLELI